MRRRAVPLAAAVAVGCAIARLIGAQSEMLPHTRANSAADFGAQGWPADSPNAGFLTRVRAASARYRDRGVAILDGYRPIGGDFPGMGEHWINVGILFAGHITPEQPPILEYATIAGRPVLIGVAYAAPLLTGESPPAFPGHDAWHEHTGTVESETDLLNQAMASHESMPGSRLAMLHVWAWLPNPAGAFHSDNWALPFVRAGLAAPAVDPGPAVGRVVSLLSGGDAFYEHVFVSVAAASPSDSIAIHDALGTAHAAAVAWAARVRENSATPEALDQLRSVWTSMWDALDSSLSAGARARLRTLRDR